MSELKTKAFIRSLRWAISEAVDRQANEGSWNAVEKDLNAVLDDMWIANPWNILPDKAAPPWNPDSKFSFEIEPVWKELDGITAEDLKKSILKDFVVPQGMVLKKDKPQSVVLDEDIQRTLDELSCAKDSDELDRVKAALGDGADELLWPPGLTVSESVQRLVFIMSVEAGTGAITGWSRDSYGTYESEKVKQYNDCSKITTTGFIDKNDEGGWNWWIENRVKTSDSENISTKECGNEPFALLAIEAAEKALGIGAKDNV